ncbi:rCG55319 [Rattus norvegicus]|uniref:RCG55319 n=1 Tax=Rattus norvegicus TaxID=10116 RepID=A6KF32_RAT|nr:rCG55319 [Rattus norvegicus]
MEEQGATLDPLKALINYTSSRRKEIKSLEPSYNPTFCQVDKN